MIYEIDNKYYVRLSGHYAEVDLILVDDDLDLKPNGHRLENNSNIKYKEIDFLSEKDNLLKKIKDNNNIQPKEININSEFNKNTFKK